MNFWNFSIKYSSIPIFAAMYAVNVTSPAQLPLVSGCRNSGAHVTCHASGVTNSLFLYAFFILFSDKVVELVGGGSVTNAPSQNLSVQFYFILVLPPNRRSLYFPSSSVSFRGRGKLVWSDALRLLLKLTRWPSSGSAVQCSVMQCSAVQ